MAYVLKVCPPCCEHYHHDRAGCRCCLKGLWDERDPRNQPLLSPYSLEPVIPSNCMAPDPDVILADILTKARRLR